MQFFKDLNITDVTTDTLKTRCHLNLSANMITNSENKKEGNVVEFFSFFVLFFCCANLDFFFLNSRSINSMQHRCV